MKKLSLYASTAALAMLLTFPAWAQTTPSTTDTGMQPTMTQIAPSNPENSAAPVGNPGKPHHPEIHHAMHAIENANKFLQQAADDYGGHKAAAMQLLQQAHQELQDALAYAHQNKQ